MTIVLFRCLWENLLTSLRSLMPLRASQNVVSDEDNDKPGVIVLVAHCDTPLTGMLLSPRLTRWPRALLISLGVITILRPRAASSARRSSSSSPCAMKKPTRSSSA